MFVELTFEFHTLSCVCGKVVGLWHLCLLPRYSFGLSLLCILLQKLLEELVQLVNEKNALVHQLDTEERAIEEDEGIEQASLGMIGGTQGQRKEDCVIQ